MNIMFIKKSLAQGRPSVLSRSLGSKLIKNDIWTILPIMMNW